MTRLKLGVLATHPIQYQVPLWKAIADREHDIRVFYTTRHGLEGNSYESEFGKSVAWDLPMLEGYQHEFCKNVRVPKLGNQIHGAIPLGLTRRFAEESFDAVLIHGYASGTAMAGLLAAWRSGTRIIMRGDTHEVGREAPTGLQRVRARLLPHVLKRVDHIVAVGTWNRAYWQKYGFPASQIRTAVYSVDNDRFASATLQQQPQALELRRQWGAEDGDVVFLFSGRLASEKAPERLLEAFSQIRQNAKLVMLGDGPLREPLQDRFSSLGTRVVWPGFVNQTSLPAYYGAADVLVLPSLFEPWGLVVNEAMACGLPCIVSDRVGAGADLIEGKDTGLVFPHDDTPALTRAMEVALEPDVLKTWRANVPRQVDRAHLRHTVDALLEFAANP